MDEDKRIGQLLLREGVITQDDLKQALEAQDQAFGKPLGEIMINLGIISEADFLRVLAKKFHTQYLTTEKLSKVNVPEAALKLVPENTAENHLLFPIQFKKKSNSLTVIMANPDDVGAVDEVKFVSGISNVKALVGIKDAIKACINRWYKDDEHAFDLLLGYDDESVGYELSGSSAPARELEDDDSPLDFEGLLSTPGDSSPGETAEEDTDLDVILDNESDKVYLGGAEEMPGNDNQAREQIVIEDLGTDDEEPMEEVTVSPLSQPEPEPEPVEEEIEVKPLRRPDVKKYRLRMLVVEPHADILKFIVKLFLHEGFQVKGVDSKEEGLIELSKGEYDSLVIKDRDLGEGEEFANMIGERFPDVELCSIKDYGSAVIGETRAHKRLMASFLETLDIIMGLFEMESGGMQGHSHNVSKYARLIAGKLDLPQREVDTIALAAYVHELGRKGMRHWTVIELDEDIDKEELIDQAEIPLKLLSAAKYPLEIAPVIRHQYEKWDGSGLPDGLKEKDIPAGARVLALVEAFEHMTNRFIKEDTVEPSYALETLQTHAGVLFDPELVELLLGVVKDDLYIQQMAAAQDRIMLVDSQMDFVRLLELRLMQMNYAVNLARTAEEAIEKAKADPPSLIVAEVDLPDMSGFEMIEKIIENEQTNDVPFLFVSKKDDSKSVNKGFKLGAEDYITKPVKVDILGPKINTMMTRLKADKKAAPAAAGVSGQLSEMSIPDIVQILSAGRKTGCITLENNGETATIEMEDGQVVNAIIEDLKGEEAFYKILYWTEGSFTIDPAAEVSERLINLSIDSLMLEGFRRMDEEGQEKSEDDIALDGSDFF